MRGHRFCAAYTSLADAWLTELLGDEPGVALVAVGSYGRRELCPGSDLDVVLLHRGRRDIGALADRLWYPIWDANVPLDHSVRTEKEVVAVTSRDLKAVLGFLSARCVAGDADLVTSLVQRIDVTWQTAGRRRLADLDAMVQERHARSGEVAFLLEPDLKEGRGGLRDLVALTAARRVTPFEVESESPLVSSGTVLLDARVELQRATGRATDRLTLQEQDVVAAALGTDADTLMAGVAGAARAIAVEADDEWRRVRSWLAGPRGRVASGDRPLGPGLVLRDGEVTLTPAFDVSSDPTAIVRTAEAAAAGGTVVARASLARLVASAPGLGDPWPPDARSSFVGLLGTGEAAIPVLEVFDHHGLLARVLPEWQAVRSKPQRNSYHRYTVDRHLLETAAAAAGLTRSVRRPDLLLVGALLHDLGKGYPGDHVAVGVSVGRVVATRMGFDPFDVDTLEAMVRLHLLLPDVATRRDLDDPATIDSVARTVGSRGLLELLAALTEADGLATGPMAWNSWKATLVGTLVARVDARLAGEEVELPSTFPTDEQRRLMALGEVAVHASDCRLTVVAPDRPGLVARVAGALAADGLDVLSAQAATVSGMAVQVYDVSPSVDGEPPWERVRADVERALTGRLPVASRLAERVSAYAGQRRPAAAYTPEPRVLFDNDGSAVATVVEVRAADGIGVLYRIARALAECDLSIRTAKIVTLGHEVVDTFYVVDLDGAKVTDPEHLDAISRQVLAEL
ncbi:MAG TPA: [protein-PII] uridylyltransferase [Acidimicrobiales bacterium]